MYTLLRAYRWVLNQVYIPRTLLRSIEKIGLRFYRSLFSGNTFRFQPYRIVPAKGVAFTAFLDWHDATDSNYIFHRAYDERNTNFLLSILRPGDIFCDIGANIGYFSLVAAAYNSRISVIAVEPLLRNIRSLEASIAANNFTNITLCQTAVGAHEGDGILQHRVLNSGSPSIVGYFGIKKVYDHALAAENVRVTTIPALFMAEKVSKCRCIKIDIQGAEYDALSACILLLEQQRIDYFLIEHNGSVYGDEVRALFKRYGYYPHRIEINGNLIPMRDDEGLRNKGDYVFAVISHE